MKHINLNGTWTLKTEDGKCYPCTVPGSMAACLLEHKVIDDPYAMDNEKNVLPIFERDYTFSNTFFVSSSDISHDRILLHCDGLDTIAEITLNGHLIGKADNMHRTWIFDVLPYIKAGENTISICFASPLQYIKTHLSQTGKRFATIRKAACMFGWDWGIELPDSGIWRDIWIEIYDDVRLNHIQIFQKHTDNEVRMDVSVDAELFGNSAQLFLTIENPSGFVLFTKEVLLTQSRKVTFTYTVQSPQLWWPVGYGEQPLYTVRATAEGNRNVSDSLERQIGLRVLTLDRSPRADGSNFGFVINGKPIFFRGENLIIEDAIISRTTPERWEKLIDNCLQSNLNGIRVWGGAYCPPNYFYELCDKYGLMVFQDFMFACTFYATTKDFVENVRIEVQENLKRIAHHACIAVYCGNNELDAIFTVMNSNEPETAALRTLFGGGNKFSRLVKIIVWHMYKKLFLKLIPSLCRTFAPETSYVHSSPSTLKPGKAKSFFDYLSNGDMHYYLQYNGNAPYQKLRDIHVRFMTEMGFQSYPSIKTIDSFASKEAQTPYSDIMYAHQKCKNGNEAIELYMERDYIVPKDFSQYVYLSQLQAGEIMKYSIEHLRRDSGYCRGMIIWQLNDCWPVVSWSGIDYYGRWKAQQYYTKRFYAPILVSADAADGIAGLWVTNDSIKTLKSVLHWRILSANGELLKHGQQHVVSAPEESTEIIRIDCAALLPDKALNEIYLHFSLSDDSQCIGEGTAIFVLAKDFQFKRPNFQIDFAEHTDTYTVTITSDFYAKGVALDTSEGDCLFSDNFFDLCANQKKTIIIRKTDVKGIDNLLHFKQRLFITCLNEVLLDNSRT